jgi:hypothetical protein
VILRIFRASVYPAAIDTFSRFLRTEALPVTRAQPGHVASWAGEPLQHGESEFAFVSVWKDLPTLQAFRGSDLSDPGILPAERTVIREASVAHYLTVIPKATIPPRTG